MEVYEIFNRILIESGQFLLEVNGVELDRDKFVILVKTVLGTYNKYDPLEDKFNLNMTNVKTYTFTDQSQNYGIPDWLSAVVPVRTSGSYNYNPSSISSASGLMAYLGMKHSNPNLEEACEFPYAYRKPTLYLSYTDIVDVHAVYKHKLREDEVDGRFNYYIDTIDHEYHLFFDLLRAKLMISLGRSRRAFTLNDLPITTDADQIVGEGKELERETMEKLYDNAGKQYLAYG